MDGVLACCAGSPRSIPAVRTDGSSCNIQMIFLPLRSMVVRKKWNQTSTVSKMQKKREGKEFLAAPPMIKDCVRERNGSTKKSMG